MSKVIVDMGMSLDGFIALLNAGPHNNLGDGEPGSTGGSTTSKPDVSFRASGAARPIRTTRWSRN